MQIKHSTRIVAYHPNPKVIPRMITDFVVSIVCNWTILEETAYLSYTPGTFISSSSYKRKSEKSQIS